MALPKPQKNESKEWPKHEAGTFQLALADVIYLGHRVTKNFKQETVAQERVALIWQSMECEPGTADRFELATEFTYSAHEKANLRKFLAPWIGPFANDAAAEAAITSLDGRIGENVLATIAHNPGKQDPSKVYVNVETVGKLMKGMQPFAVASYTRKDYWTKKIADYAAAYTAFLTDKGKAKEEAAVNAEKFPGAAPGLDEFPAALDAGNDEDPLPF